MSNPWGLVELKTDPEPFEAIRSGVKTCEIRKNDRGGFATGQRLLLREHERPADRYTGRSVIVLVTHVQSGYGLPADLVALSVKRLWPGDA